jgi:hypothetical protein
MSEVIVFPQGGYRYIKGVFQYSAGVAAEPGFEIERARFSRPVPLAEGFGRIEAHLARLGRPTTAFCACELRRLTPAAPSSWPAAARHPRARETTGIAPSGSSTGRLPVCGRKRGGY